MPRKPPTPRPIKVRQVPTLKKGPLRHSKRVLDRLKATRSLLSTIDDIKDQVARRLPPTVRQRAPRRRDRCPTSAWPSSSPAARSRPPSISSPAPTPSTAAGRPAPDAQRGLHRRSPATRSIPSWSTSGAPSTPASAATPGAAPPHRGQHPAQAPAATPSSRGLVVALRDYEKLPPPVRPGPAGERRKLAAAARARLPEADRDAARSSTTTRSSKSGLRNDRDFELESFDVVYGETLDFVRSVLRLSGCDERVIWHLLPTVQRRRLKAKARKESGGPRRGPAVTREKSSRKLGGRGHFVPGTRRHPLPSQSASQGPTSETGPSREWPDPGDRGAEPGQPAAEGPPRGAERGQPAAGRRRRGAEPGHELAGRRSRGIEVGQRKTLTTGIDRVVNLPRILTPKKASGHQLRSFADARPDVISSAQRRF